MSMWRYDVVVFGVYWFYDFGSYFSCDILVYCVFKVLFLVIKVLYYGDIFFGLDFNIYYFWYFDWFWCYGLGKFVYFNLVMVCCWYFIDCCW